MKKILLIEDRTIRQKQFIDDMQMNLNNYSDVLDNCIDEQYENILKELKVDDFNFNNYSMIISHESAFGDDNSFIISKLEKYCKNNKKILVLFSGGIDTNYYLKDEEFELIKINSKTFYSENLKLFLEEFRKGNFEPLILTYGDKWKLNILLNVLEKINCFVKTNNDEFIYFDDFIDGCAIKSIDIVKEDIYIIEEDMEIHRDEIEKLKVSIINVIKKISDE